MADANLMGKAGRGVTSIKKNDILIDYRGHGHHLYTGVMKNYQPKQWIIINYKGNLSKLPYICIV